MENTENSNGKTKANINYLFNVKYYDFMYGNNKSELETINKKIYKTELFNEDLLDGLNFNTFELEVGYPGLLHGLGYMHESGNSETDEIKTGFALDYVTGMPYIAGSSIKGSLRSYFGIDGQKDAEGRQSYIKSKLNVKDININDFGKQIFEEDDIFFDAIPIAVKHGKLFGDDYITPHKDKFKNPVPIKMLRVLPKTVYRFRFKLSDYVDESRGITITSKDKKKLFKDILLDVGIGAKTNVGYGVLLERSSK